MKPKQTSYGEKSRVCFRPKNVLNIVSVFRKLVRLRYQDGSSMAEHLNTFQGLISQTISLDIRSSSKCGVDLVIVRLCPR